MKVKTTVWDAAAHLKTKEDMAAYLSCAFEEGDAAVLHAACEFDCMKVIEAAVCIYVKGNSRANCLANSADTHLVFRDDFREGARRIPARERLMAHHHFQPPVALAYPEFCRCGQLLSVEHRKSKCRVHRNFRSGSAEQSPYGQAKRLSLDIPKCDVDGGDGV